MTNPRPFATLAAFACLLGSHLDANPPEAVSAALFTENAPVAPNWIENRTVYELNLRQFSDEGTLAAAESELDRIQNLGIGVIWLMPIHPIGETNRKGPMGSYYAVADYYGVNPEFGDAAALRSFIQAAHQRDIKVILDWVANHTAWDNPLAASHPEFYATDPSGSFTPPRGTDWSDVIQLDFENRELWDYMIDAMAYWVTEYDVDGFRCDYAAGVPVAFWNAAAERLRSEKPDIFLLAEAESPALNVDAFHASYGWPMHHVFNDIAQAESPASRIQDQLNRQSIHFPNHALLLNFTTNHDENSWNGTTAERLGPAKRAFDTLAFTLPGIPLIYNGQEASLAKRLAFFSKDPIDWSDLSESAFYQTLTAVKRSSPALRATAPIERLATTADERVFAFRRYMGHRHVLVFLNLSSEPVAFFAKGDTLTGPHRDLFADETVQLSNPLELQLAPWEFKVFQR